MQRTLITLLMGLALTTAIYAQQRGQPRGQRPDQTAILKEALNVTDAQIAAINTLNQTRRDRAEAIFAEIEEKRTALDALLNAAPPNATTVGNAAISLHASQNKLRAEADWYLVELKKLLTGEQQQTLDGLLAANSRSPVLGALGLGGPGGPGGPGGRGRGPRIQ